MDDLIKRLQAKAKTWATNITKKSHENLGQYRKLIRVQSKVVTESNIVSIETTAYPTARSEYGDVKNVARAYEYGSGIHSRVRSRKSPKQQPDGRIRIAPRRKKVLAFQWEKVNAGTPKGAKFRGISQTTGKALFRFVEHPGVMAANGGKGYLAPAIKEVNKQIRKDIPPEMKAVFDSAVKRAFSKGKK